MKHYRPFGFTVRNQQLPAIHQTSRLRSKTLRKWTLVYAVLAATCQLLPANETKAQSSETNALEERHLAQADPGDANKPSGSPQPAQSADSPSDDDIILATKEHLRRELLQSIAADYGNLDRLSGDAFGTVGGMAPATTQRILGCTLNAPAEKTRCIQKLKVELLAERAEKVKDAKSAWFAADFIFRVENKRNYEGNYVAFVNMRQRGTDRAWQLKVLLQFRNGAWVVIDKSEKTIS